MLDALALTLVRLVAALLSPLSQETRVSLLTLGVRAAVALRPSYRRYAHVNLALAFPEKDEAWRERILRRSYRELGRLLADFVRLPRIDRDWMREHLDPQSVEDLVGCKARHPEKGVLSVTGHLGSFELLSHCYALNVGPVSVVARNFKLKRLDDWWNGVRELHNVKVISRSGAFSDVVRELEAGRDIGLLSDQNVRRRHAVFVDLFGKKASLTKTIGLAALRTGCTIAVVSLKYCGSDRYKILARECETADIIATPGLSSDQKIELISQRAVSMYEDMIREFPEGWFWMHRRFRTRPGEDEANPYE